jgi:hypothetical protein
VYIVIENMSSYIDTFLVFFSVFEGCFSEAGEAAERKAVMSAGQPGSVHGEHTRFRPVFFAR